MEINPFMKSTTQDSLWLFNVCLSHRTHHPSSNLAAFWDTRCVEEVLSGCWCHSGHRFINFSQKLTQELGCFNYLHLKWLWTKENTNHFLILQFCFNITECKNTWVFTQALEWGFWNFVHSNAGRQLELILSILVGSWKLWKVQMGFEILVHIGLLKDLVIYGILMLCSF